MRSDDPPFSVSAAWALVRESVNWLAALFGPPATLRDQSVLKKRDHALLLSWLRSLEALVSRLLLIAALEMGPQPAQARPVCAGRARGKNWRVAFRLHSVVKPAPAPQRARTGPRGASERRDQAGCRGAAARFEALRRVAENPGAYARRLACALRRKAHWPARIAAAPIRPGDPFAENAAAARAHLLVAFPTRLGPS